MSHWTRLAAAVLALAPIGLVAQLASQRPLFVAAPSVPVGVGSGEIVLADFNRDGHVDMATRHLLQRHVSILLGDGKAAFSKASRSPIALGYQPGGIAAADVNGDRIPDLGIANSERDAVEILLGDGTGGFSAAPGSPFTVSASTEFYTRMLRLVDVNNDRRLDVVSANGRDNTFGILLGDGGGRFSAGSIMRTDSGGLRHAFAFGDVDGDGYVDAITTSHGDDTGDSGRVAVLRGDGAGRFTESWRRPIPGGQSVTLADVNGDDRLDVVMCHGERAFLTVLMNDGRGAFTPGSPAAVSSGAYAATVADVDGDKKADVVAATGTGVAILLGDGRGGFKAAAGSPFAAGPGAYNLTVGDLNEDGRPDVASSSFEGNAVTILLGR